jgi:DNA-binding GntR family transcriptional regulator
MADIVVPAVSRTSLRDQVTAAIRDMVLSRQLRPGERIVQTELAQRLGVSRMPVRDAINTLCAEGLLVLDGTVGSAVVAEVRVEDVQDSYVVHATILALIGRRAAQRITPQALAELSKVHEQMGRAVERGDRDAAARLNRAFHKIINVAAGSPRLAALLRLSDISIPHSTYAVENWPRRALHEHGEILAALRSHDGELAQELLRQHVAAGSELMLASIVRREEWEGRDDTGRASDGRA